MSHLVRVSDQTYAKMCKEKPPGMTQGQYFDLLVENQSRAMEVQRDVSEKLQKILEMLSEKPASEFNKSQSNKMQKNESGNAGDMFTELFQNERKKEE